LAGRFPFANKPTGIVPGEIDHVVAELLEDRVQPPGPARRWNPAVSHAVDAILRRCLEPDPARRYQSARQLREDLQCQLESLPLRHAREPLGERIRKQLRRSPRLLPRLAAGFAVLMLLLAVGFGLRARYLSRVREAQETLRETEKEILEIRFALRPELDPVERARAEERCRSILNRYGVFEKDWREHALFADLDGSDQNRLAEGFGELLYLLARSAVQSTRILSLGSEERRKLFQQALSDNQRAETCFDEDSVPPALLFQRADLLEKLGDGEAAQRQRAEAAKRPLQTARARYLAALEHTLARRFRQALPLLEEAVDLEPRYFWAWMMMGICHDGLGNIIQAVTDYNAAAALAPEFHGVYFNRGLAYLRQRKHVAAALDFDRAIAFGGGTLDAYINRSLAREHLGRYAEALADLDCALKMDASATQLYFQRYRVRLKAKDPRAADDLAEGMRRTPGDVRSWNALGNAYLARADTAPLFGLFEALLALSAFEQGLKQDPDHPATLISKASVLSERFGRNRDALAVQDRLVQLYPEYPIGLSGRGVLHARLGNRAAALEDAESALELTHDRFVVYQAGNIYALTSRQEPTDARRAFVLLHEALGRGFGASLLPTDPDLEPLHHLPEFQRLRALAARKANPPRPPTSPGGNRP
ncbi:MAG: tetratricopeptide repeat protein, partial [Planctomycetes bacterium]|nr:tetratricopeptide repeat protein [Planctomycetota bacterium]